MENVILAVGLDQSWSDGVHVILVSAIKLNQHFKGDHECYFPSSQQDPGSKMFFFLYISESEYQPMSAPAM